MTTHELETWLVETIETAIEDDTTCPIHHVATFEDVGMLTRDRGLVVAFNDCSEIQVTLVQSRRGHGER